MTETRLDCVVIGYNELPFRDYVQTMREFGEGSEAYRDLRSNFVEIDGAPLKYMDLLDRVLGGTWNLRSCDIPNLAAVYLTHFLERRVHRAEFINLFQEEKQRLAELLAAEPRCVAITTTFYVFNLPVNEMVQ